MRVVGAGIFAGRGNVAEDAMIEDPGAGFVCARVVCLNASYNGFDEVEGGL